MKLGILDDLLKKKGPIRTFLEERKPLLERRPKILKSFSRSPVIDERFESLREAKRREWTARGIPEKLQKRALEWATEYSSGMARRIAPDEPELRKRIEDALYPQSLDLATRWIEGLMKAML